MAADSPLSDATEWDGYSDYAAISRNVAKSVSEAVENWAWLDAILRENGNPKPDQVAMARAAVLGAAVRMFVEMREERQNGDKKYDDVLSRWAGVEDLGEVDDPEDRLNEIWASDAPEQYNPDAIGDQIGYLRAFQVIELDQSVPAWVGQFVSDIRTAARKLGYLQAGRRSKKDPEDPVQAEAEHMLRGG